MKRMRHTLPSGESQKPSTAVRPVWPVLAKDPRTLTSVKGLGASGPATFTATSIVFLLLQLLELSKNPQFVLRFGILTLLAVEPAEQVMRLGIVSIRLHGLAQRLQRLVIASLESKNLRHETPAFPRTRIDFNRFLQIRQTLRKIILPVEKSPEVEIG